MLSWQLTPQNSYLIKLASFVREILNLALARASTLSDDSTVLNELVLHLRKNWVTCAGFLQHKILKKNKFKVYIKVWEHEFTLAVHILEQAKESECMKHQLSPPVEKLPSEKDGNYIGLQQADQSNQTQI
jgi:hypothetical protein